jgi:hypothetical protein
MATVCWRGQKCSSWCGAKTAYTNCGYMSVFCRLVAVFLRNSMVTPSYWKQLKCFGIFKTLQTFSKFLKYLSKNSGCFRFCRQVEFASSYLFRAYLRPLLTLYPALYCLAVFRVNMRHWRSRTSYLGPKSAPVWFISVACWKVVETESSLQVYFCRPPSQTLSALTFNLSN